jgi:type IV pilus assembly protein PilV
MKPMRTKVNHKQKGFSLIELLIAITILSIGLLALASLQGTALNGSVVASRVATCTSLAQGQLDELLSRELQPPSPGFPANATYQLFSNGGAGILFANLSVRGSDRFTANFTITPNTPAVNISQVRVDVTYTKSPVPYSVYGYKLVPPPVI